MFTCYRTVQVYVSNCPILQFILVLLKKQNHFISIHKTHIYTSLVSGMDSQSKRSEHTYMIINKQTFCFYLRALQLTESQISLTADLWPFLVDLTITIICSLLITSLTSTHSYDPMLPCSSPSQWINIMVRLGFQPTDRYHHTVFVLDRIMEK